MRVTETGYYTHVNGIKVRIVCVDANRDHPHAFPLIAITNEGNVYRFSHREIVGKWVEKPVVNWDAMPAWANYVAQDADGMWHWFTCVPEATAGAGSWNAMPGSPRGPGTRGAIPRRYTPQYTGSWENSLVARPNVEQETP